MSGIGDETLAVRAVREGAQDYLLKGQVNRNLLVRAIRYAIERKGAENTLKKYSEELEEANRLKDIFTDIMRPDLLRLVQVKLDLNMVFKTVVDYHMPNIEKKEIKLNYIAKGEYSAMANPLIEVVFSNLLGNAIKHSHQGSKIEVNVIDENMHYRIYVKDWGYGIKNEDKENIFTYVQRGNKKGMGLAIVKRVVELQGGRVWIEDNPEGGSIFYVKIPKG
jgi:signal transduction histidine kinase